MRPNRCPVVYWLAGVFLLVGTPSRTHCAPPIPPNGLTWVTELQDDFAGTTLDRSLWDPYYTWGYTTVETRTHNYDAYILDANTTVEGGKLRLRSRRNGDPRYTYKGATATFTTGVVTATRFVCRRGWYYEASMQLPRGYQDIHNGLWPAFWLTSRGEWPPEIDIFEFFGSNLEYAGSVHWDEGSGPRHQSVTVSTPTATTRFHTYGMHWRDDDSVDIYFDDVHRGTVRHPEPDTTMVLMINFGICGPNDSADTWKWNDVGGKNVLNNTFPIYYEVDWVRVWRRTAVTQLNGGSATPGATLVPRVRSRAGGRGLIVRDLLGRAMPRTAVSADAPRIHMRVLMSGADMP